MIVGTGRSGSGGPALFPVAACDGEVGVVHAAFATRLSSRPVSRARRNRCRCRSVHAWLPSKGGSRLRSAAAPPPSRGVVGQDSRFPVPPV